MHIEPGYLSAAKLVYANVTAVGLIGFYLQGLLRNPADILRTVLAAIFFSLFMQSFHMPVGPSELHFVGGIAIYLMFGFVPALLGFAGGLLLQGVLFEPADLINLAVNSLSLMLPLVSVHYTFGRRFTEFGASNGISWKQVLQMDAAYYAGVTSMVGFWLFVGDQATVWLEWAKFASSYVFVVMFEPLLSIVVLYAIRRYHHARLVQLCFAVDRV